MNRYIVFVRDELNAFVGLEIVYAISLKDAAELVSENYALKFMYDVFELGEFSSFVF